jgi:hypothetical protein
MNKCSEKGCRERALSLSDYCWRHLSQKQDYRDMLDNYVDTHHSIKGLYLRHIEFEKAQWQGIDAEGVDLAGSDLSGADLTAANMKGANLTGANFHRANLASVDFENSHMLKCNFQNSCLWHAVIKDANIAESDFRESDLLGAVFTNVKFWHVKLDGAKSLTSYSFTGKMPINETGALSASEAYRDLKQYFVSNGRYDDASWACFKEKTFQRKDLLKNKRLSYIPSLLMALFCGYGEKPYRVVISSIFLVLLYSILYAVFGALKIPAQAASNYLSLWDYIYFSIVTFTTVGFGDLTPKMQPFFQMLVGSEAFTGAFMMGLFVFTLARKYTAR